MKNDFTERLNKILDRVTSDEFLQGRGLGNEIPFYAFDYPPQYELPMREHIDFLIGQIPKRRPGVRVKHINLFDLILGLLDARSLYEKALELYPRKGDDGLLRALSGPIQSSKIAQAFINEADLDHHDMVFVSGIGNAFPLLRTHNLLNNLHPLMGRTPLVLFYPGIYDGKSLRLFGLLQDKPYYRAFRLVD